MSLSATEFGMSVMQLWSTMRARLRTAPTRGSSTPRRSLACWRDLLSHLLCSCPDCSTMEAPPSHWASVPLWERMIGHVVPGAFASESYTHPLFPIKTSSQPWLREARGNSVDAGLPPGGASCKLEGIL